MVIFHKVPNMSRDMFIREKKTFPVDGFLKNEPVLDVSNSLWTGFKNSNFFENVFQKN
jgi:hypothetical protein